MGLYAVEKVRKQLIMWKELKEWRWWRKRMSKPFTFTTRDNFVI